MPARPCQLPAGVVLALLFLGALSCSPSTPPTVPVPVLTTVTVALSPGSILIGQSAVASASGVDQNGAAIAVGTIAWSSGSPAVASVNVSGAITALSVGQTEIIARAGGRQGQATLTVTAAPVASVTVTPSTASLFTGTTQQFTAILRDAGGNLLTGREVTWSTSNASVVTVIAGVATAIARGTATITATSEGMTGTASIIEQGNSFPSLAAGYSHTCGSTTGGAAYCWGLNSSAQFGNGLIVNSSTPVPVMGGVLFAALTPGAYHTCGRTTTGSTYCWGENQNGALGDGTTLPRYFPVAVQGGLVFTALTEGKNSSCGLTSTGVGYCWGRNDFGQLGDGTRLQRSAPVAIQGGLVFAGLSAGDSHTCGRTGAGGVFCWGRGLEGQLGNGATPQDAINPVAVQGGPALSSLTAGGWHSCGLTSAGAAYCWGDNTRGQLGDGTTTNRPNPVAVLGGLVFTALAIGGDWASGGLSHTCGLTSAGAAYCWGSNDNGELGDGTTTLRLSPVAVQGGLVFTLLTAGGFHTCAKTSAGLAYCWGRNQFGELGDGTTTNRSIPVAVILP